MWIPPSLKSSAGMLSEPHALLFFRHLMAESRFSDVISSRLRSGSRRGKQLRTSSLCTIGFRFSRFL